MTRYASNFEGGYGPSVPLAECFWKEAVWVSNDRSNLEAFKVVFDQRLRNAYKSVKIYLMQNNENLENSDVRPSIKFKCLIEQL